MRSAAILLGALASSAGAQIVSNPGTVAPPMGRYSHLAVVPAGSDLLFLAGQVGNRRDGTLPPDVTDQYEQAMMNVLAILASEGATPRNIVKVTLYATNPLDPRRAAAVRKAVLGDAVPPSTFVYVSRLVQPEYLIEIDVVAVRPKR